MLQLHKESWKEGITEFDTVHEMKLDSDHILKVPVCFQLAFLKNLQT
jgi:hypothetical protein